MSCYRRSTFDILTYVFYISIINLIHTREWKCVWKFKDFLTICPCQEQRSRGQGETSVCEYGGDYAMLPPHPLGNNLEKAEFVAWKQTIFSQKNKKRKKEEI